MNKEPANSGSKVVHGKERKFGIAVISIVFIVLFFGGALLLWGRTKAIKEQQDLLTEAVQLGAVFTSAQEEIAAGVSSANLEPITTQHYQAIQLKNGETYIGKIVETNDKEVKVEKPLKLDERAYTSPQPREGLRTLAHDTIEAITSIPEDSKLTKLLNKLGR